MRWHEYLSTYRRYMCVCVGGREESYSAWDCSAQNVLQTNCQVFLWLTSWLEPSCHACLTPPPLILTLAVPLAELQKVHSETPREHLPRHSVWLCWHSWAHLARPERTKELSLCLPVELTFGMCLSPWLPRNSLSVSSSLSSLFLSLFLRLCS